MLLTVRRCGSQMEGKRTGMLTGVTVLCCYVVALPHPSNLSEIL